MPSEHESSEMNDANNTGFACALCNKSFVRRDLRNRHRRRCEKSIGKQRVSKKRSCDACGKSKLRCDLQQPSCSRCITRQIPCQYPPETIAAAAAAMAAQQENNANSLFADNMMFTADDMSGASFGTSTPTSSYPGFYPPLPMGVMTGTSSPAHFVGSMDEMDLASFDPEGLSRANSEIFDPTGTAFLTDTPAHQEAFFSAPLPAYQYMNGRSSVHGSIHEDTLFNSTMGHGFNSPPELMPASHLAFPTTMSAPRSSSNDNSYPNSTFSFETGSTASPESSLADAGLFMKHQPNSRPLLNIATPTSHTSPKTLHQSVSPTSPVNQSPSTNFHDMAAQSLPTPVHSRPGSISSLDQLSLALQSSCRTLFSIEEAATILCDYPTEMLDKSYKSPFLHFKSHHSSEPGLPEPIAVALCCVSAKSSSVESSLPFVYKMIDQQWERLLQEFPKKQMDLEETWAFLHALCIYQIESMLAMRKHRHRDWIMSSELHHAFLLKMTKAAAKHNIHRLKVTDNKSLEWRTWTLIETLRRNIFLVNMINDLSFATKALNSHYYEPLEDEYVADLPLPAPESVWKARSPQEWSDAIEATNWSNEGIVTLGQAMRRLHLGDDAGDLDPLQKLVVSCAWRRVKP